MANPIKLKRLKGIAEALKTVDKRAAFDLISIIETIERPIRPIKAIEESLEKGLKELAQKMRGLDWCLAGALAVLQWAEIRKTADIDCLVLASDLDEVKKRFKTEPGLLGVSGSADGTDIDFLSSEHFPWSKDAIATAVLKNISGVTVPVMRPEYLVAFKLRSARDRDISDALHLLLIDGVADKARAVITKHDKNSLPDLEQLISMTELGAI